MDVNGALCGNEEKWRDTRIEDGELARGPARLSRPRDCKEKENKYSPIPRTALEMMMIHGLGVSNKERTRD